MQPQVEVAESMDVPLGFAADVAKISGTEEINQRCIGNKIFLTLAKVGKQLFTAPAIDCCF